VESPFEVLGIEPDADEDDVQQAYRRRVMETHPDHGGSTDEFQAVIDAYEALQTDDPMAAFDAKYADNGHGEGPSDEDVGDADEVVEEDPRTDWPHVEYLNYEVIEDNGWSLEDDDLFEKAAATDLDPADYGQFLVEPTESLLEAAENRGFSWPFACRGGACANCAVAVVEGEMEMPANHILSSEMIDRGIRLSCISAPVTDDLKVVFNIKHLPGLDELRLPADRFERGQFSR
jgi:curved DNA-binding protein CbpA